MRNKKKEKEMTFEVVKNSKAVFLTEHNECVYPAKTLRHLSKAGYTFRIDGKRASLDTVITTYKK